MFSAATCRGQTAEFWEAARNRMVQRDVVDAGIEDVRIRNAIRDTQRHLFVPQAQRQRAYLDMALPIGDGQTISPAFIVAYMTQQLDPQPTDKVLEIGTGSGYQAAVLSPLVADVYSIEIVKPLGRRAASTLQRLRYKNVHTKIGDGFLGWAEHAPFDKMIFTCSPENIPVPLVQQLREGGRIIAPMGERYQQAFYSFVKKNGRLERKKLRSTYFVPMTGRAEQLRRIKDAPRDGVLINGNFDAADKDSKPLGWYYVRQARVMGEGSAARTTSTPNGSPASLADAKQSNSPAGKLDGQTYLRCMNKDAGRLSQALQAVSMDGRRTSHLAVSLRIRTVDVLPGQSPRELPRLEVTFFDDDRHLLKTSRIGPWHGTMQWTTRAASFEVPPRARVAVLMIGLFGGVGTADFDNLKLEAVARGSRRKSRR